MRGIVLVIIILNLNTIIYGQNNPKFDLKLSSGEVVNARIYNYPYIDEHHLGGSWTKKEKVAHFRIDANYSFDEKIQAGLYMGISRLTVPDNPDNIYDTTSGTASGYFYGSQVNYHILPLLIKHHIRFDIYGTAKIGIVNKRWGGYHNQPIYNDNTLETGAGLGAGFYFSPKFGIFAEALIGKFYYSNFNWRAGLSFKF